MKVLPLGTSALVPLGASQSQPSSGHWHCTFTHQPPALDGTVLSGARLQAWAARLDARSPATGRREATTGSSAAAAGSSELPCAPPACVSVACVLWALGSGFALELKSHLKPHRHESLLGMSRVPVENCGGATCALDGASPPSAQPLGSCCRGQLAGGGRGASQSRHLHVICGTDGLSWSHR